MLNDIKNPMNLEIKELKNNKKIKNWVSFTKLSLGDVIDSDRQTNLFQNQIAF